MFPDFGSNLIKTTFGNHTTCTEGFDCKTYLMLTSYVESYVVILSLAIAANRTAEVRELIVFSVIVGACSPISGCHLCTKAPIHSHFSVDNFLYNRINIVDRTSNPGKLHCRRNNMIEFQLHETKDLHRRLVQLSPRGNSDNSLPDKYCWTLANLL
ncbi:hypothetical protein J6590_034360 [Homalodisca vitripennis]|nr:hypothetical protein J6590_034360 [Homalodisca vitripennis]